MQKQHLIVNAILLVPNNAIFYQDKYEKKNVESEKDVDAGGTYNMCWDDKLIDF